MEFLNYAIAAIIVALGLVCGIVLRLFTKEEMKAGKKYFIYLEHAFFAAIIALMIYFKAYYALTLLFVIAFFAFLYKGKMKKPIPASVYIFFALLFFEASRNSAFILFSSLMFLFGFPAGSLIDLKKKRHTKAIISVILFLVIAFVLFFIIP